MQAAIYFRQAKALDAQQRSTEHLAATALKQFEITDRPWLWFDADFSGPLTFTDGNMELPFRLVAKNVGRSVAVNATINAKVVIPRLGPNCDLYAEVLAEQQKVCQNVKSRFNSYTIFPDGVYELGMAFNVGLQEVENGRLPKTNFITAYLVGCVDYKFPGHEAHHQTRFACEVLRAHSENPNIKLSLEIGQDVPLERLILRKLFISGGDYAD
jgi:hypothetical protein